MFFVRASRPGPPFCCCHLFSFSSQQCSGVLPIAGDRLGGVGDSSQPLGGGGARVGAGSGGLVHNRGDAVVRRVPRDEKTAVPRGVSGGAAVRVLRAHHGVLMRLFRR